MALRIENLTGHTSGGSVHFVAVYKNGECLGTVLTDGTMTAKECYESLLSNWGIDDMEKQHYANLEGLEL